MDQNRPDNSSPHCSAQELKIFGDFWVLTIIQELRDGEKRFSQLVRAIPGGNAVTITDRLRRLEDQRMVVRQESTSGKSSVSYILSTKGRDALPILEEIFKFGNKYS